METAYRPELWHDAYIALCGAAAALTGLLFIATSLHIKTIANDLRLRYREAANTLLIVWLIVESALVLLPQSASALGIELCVTGCAFVPVVFVFGVRWRRLGSHMSWRGYAALVLSLVGAAGGVSLIIEWGGGMFIVTTRFLATLSWNIFSAYKLLMVASAEEPGKDG